MNQEKYAFFVGRVQPPHQAHFKILRHGLDNYDKILIGVGSAYKARDPKNPFKWSERVEMINAGLSASEKDRVQCVPIRDYLYNDDLWAIDVQNKVNNFVPDDASIKMIGRLKDKSSYYLKRFPQWGTDEYHTTHPQNATNIRKAMFDGDWGFVEESVHTDVAHWLSNWKKSDDFSWLLEEHRFVEKYHADWAGSPYPPTFVTVDAVVIQSSHVLLVRRKSAPGKGLLALPGGFVNQDEMLVDSMLRELKQETSIYATREFLRDKIKKKKEFDHPERSLRGRTITHAYHIRLPDGELKEVKGGDDAAKAFWMPLADVFQHEEEFFEDHLHIIRYFT